jgi:hypothetical protein
MKKNVQRRSGATVVTSVGGRAWRNCRRRKISKRISHNSCCMCGKELRDGENCWKWLGT